MRIVQVLPFLALAACAGDADTVLLDVSPSLVSSLDGTTQLSVLVAASSTPLPDEPVTATIEYTDRNGTAHDIAPIEGTTDARGVYRATIEGLRWDGTGTVTVASGSATSTATFAVLDRTPPHIEILPPTTDLHVGQGLPLDVRVRVTDEIGMSEVSLDDGSGNTRTTLVASGALDATLDFRLGIQQNAVAGPTITLHALARDVSGNLAAAEAITLIVDPAITIATPPGLTGTAVVTGTAQQLSDPRAIVVSAKDGKLYVADAAQTGACSGGCIWRVDPGTGAIDATPVLVGQGTIEGIALDATGDNLYYTDRQNRIGRLTWNGTAYAGASACIDTQAQRPQDPYHLVFDATLGILVADDDRQELARVATCTAASTAAAFSMNSQFEQPRGVALAPTGSIFVSELGRDRISTVDRTTGAVTTYASVREPYGIEWVGGTTMWGDRLMVASRGDRIVESVGAGGALAAAYLREAPIDLAVAGDTMYVVTAPTQATRGRIYKVVGF